MRTLDVTAITEAVARLAIEANYELPADVYAALGKAVCTEKAPLGREIIGNIVRNADIARLERVPICQDTGMAVVFMEVGQDVHFTGGTLAAAVDRGVALGYERGYLRKSVVAEPLFERINTHDNTPAILYTTIVPGDKVRIVMAPKGFGSENMSAVQMFKPSDGIAAVKSFVVETVKKAGPNPCPPMIVGVGLGGTMEKAAYLAKQALTRPLASSNPDQRYAAFERELLAQINSLGIGPQGLGGTTTALGVNVEYFPTHIAGLPVAVNINCHATRHTAVEI